MRGKLVRFVVPGVLALGLLLLQPERAHAANVPSVQELVGSVAMLFEELEYERALTQIRYARGLPRSTQEDVTLFIYEGLILCEVGEWAGGTAAFKSALALSPEVKLPVKAAPSVEALFEAVRPSLPSEGTPPTLGGGAPTKEEKSSLGETRLSTVQPNVEPSVGTSSSKKDTPLPVPFSVEVKFATAMPVQRDWSMQQFQSWRLRQLESQICATEHFKADAAERRLDLHIKVLSASNDQIGRAHV